MSNEAFENEIQAQLAELHIQPDASVWHQVATQIQPQKKKRRGLVWWWLSMPLLIIVGSIVWVYSNKHSYSVEKHLTVNETSLKNTRRQDKGTSITTTADKDDSSITHTTSTPQYHTDNNNVVRVDKLSSPVGLKNNNTSIQTYFNQRKANQQAAASKKIENRSLINGASTSNSVAASTTGLSKHEAAITAEQNVVTIATVDATETKNTTTSAINKPVEDILKDSSSAAVAKKITTRKWLLSVEGGVGIATTRSSNVFGNSIENSSNNAVSIGNGVSNPQQGGVFNNSNATKPITYQSTGMSIRLGVYARRYFQQQYFIYVSGAYQWNNGSVVIGGRKDTLININGTASNYAYVGGVQERKKLSEHLVVVSGGIGNTFNIKSGQLHAAIGLGGGYVIGGNRLHTDVANTSIAIDDKALYRRMQIFIEPQLFWQLKPTSQWIFGMQVQWFLNSISKGNNGGYRSMYHATIRRNF